MKAIPGCRATTVVDPNEAAARALAKTWGIENVHGSVAAALDSGPIDCAHILVPPQHHHAIAAEFLEAGIPVLLEKPLGVSVQECESLT
ncbi:MAG: Gfo/Idh/MocA family oxidoreductase, partial [Alphaproteobacteria bacterium]|nr:Gfo/Idh/MocA family oxidoreductase [Alphaproteobacteria bacterium]